MGDIFSLLRSFDLAPITTLLLATGYFVLQHVLRRVEHVEQVVESHATHIARIQGRLENQKDR